MSRMLKFAVVGTHGRKPSTLLVLCVVPWLWLAPLTSQAPTELQDLLPELAAKIAAVVPSDSQVTLVASAPESSSAATRNLQEAIVTHLASHRVRVVAAGSATASVAVSCSENLRERSCVAEIQAETRRDVVIVTRRHDGTAERESRPTLSLELESLLAQRTPILDVANLGERVLILDATSVALHRRADKGWQQVSSRPLPVMPTWPRDLRGRVRVEDDRFSVFLPGVACAGRLGSLALECTESRQPWPLGIDNNGLEPGRNYFSTPEGLQFYSAAALGADADARWVIADRNGGLSVLDSFRRPLSRVATADDVAGIVATCAPENYILASELSAGRDAIRLFQVVRRRLVPIAAPAFVTGKLTALWSEPGATAATAVAHDMSSGRYEAFLATVSCGR